MRVGDCIADPSLTGDVAVQLVGCDEAHRFEIYASVPMLEGSFPGGPVVEQFTNAACDAAFEIYVGTTRDDSQFAVGSRSGYLISPGVGELSSR